MKKELWLRLKGYHFDHLVPPHLADHVSAAFGGADASTKAFASKLARKLNWSTPFALRAIDEYKKFVYLGMISDFSVTPPKLIDQVWHEHLLFTRAYRDFCDDVLGQEFDHNPELVPTNTQTDTFQAQYVATLDLYKSEFNVDPPYEFWGTPKFKRVVDTAEGLKPKPRPGSSDYGGDPLYTFFDTSSSGHAHAHAMPEFGGGGGFSGGGTEGSWGGHSHGHGDAGHGDGGHGGDGGSGDGGGSGCSSSCGGGGCGGGGCGGG